MYKEKCLMLTTKCIVHNTHGDNKVIVYRYILDTVDNIITQSMHCFYQYTH